MSLKAFAESGNLQDDDEQSIGKVCYGSSPSVNNNGMRHRSIQDVYKMGGVGSNVMLETRNTVFSQTSLNCLLSLRVILFPC